MKKVLIGLFVIAFVGGGFAMQAFAVSGKCVNCHTMHNSQDGSPMTVDDSPTPNPLLLKGDCLGCHAQATASTIDGSGKPQVAPIGSSFLAGGSFNYVGTADANGHNVLGIDNQDGTLNNDPPGYGGSGYTTTETQLSCAGTSGCHGDRSIAGSADTANTGNDLDALKGAHHSNAGGEVSGASVGTSYRFLDGITGNEDDDWENTVSASDHNQYQGAARSSSAVTAGTISSLCAECHGNFHNGNGNVGQGSTFASAWLRHPTDLDLGAAGVAAEHASYNPGDSNNYNWVVPVASTNVSTVLSAPDPGTAGQAIVMCLSCHRPHGTAEPDALRFDYDTMVAGSTVGAETGCFVCHTEKDA